MNLAACAFSFLQTGGIGLSESREKVECSSCSQDWHHLHFIVSTLLLLNKILMVVVTGQSLLQAVHDPLLEITK